jgi:cytochrome c oxidase subunit 3
MKIVVQEGTASDTHEGHRDDAGAKVGMWLFLVTEILLFGGMFLLYSIFRTKHPLEFHNAAQHLSTFIGTVNTVILLTSSLTMALAIAAVRRANRKLSLLFQVLTILMGLAFLVNKYFEWSAKIHHGIFPNSPELLTHAKGEILFYGLYYVMTGMHGLHVVIGLVLLTVMFVFTQNGRINQGSFVRLENSGLYWHLVDLIWIYLFPLFYLIT